MALTSTTLRACRGVGAAARQEAASSAGAYSHRLSERLGKVQKAAGDGPVGGGRMAAQHGARHTQTESAAAHWRIQVESVVASRAHFCKLRSLCMEAVTQQG